MKKKWNSSCRVKTLWWFRYGLGMYDCQWTWHMIISEHSALKFSQMLNGKQLIIQQDNDPKHMIDDFVLLHVCLSTYE